MLRSKLIALLAAAATLLPAAARADDEWQGTQYTDEWTDERPSDGYDVSVDDVGPSGSVTFETFQSSLAAHGQWVDVPAYGRVWRPAPHYQLAGLHRSREHGLSRLCQSAGGCQYWW